MLIEVAQAIQHLHSLKLIHCDIKPENVLLKSDGSKPIGFVTKLSDFGLAKLLRENYYIVNRSGSGTVTHLAPELFQVRARRPAHRLRTQAALHLHARQAHFVAVFSSRGGV